MKTSITSRRNFLFSGTFQSQPAIDYRTLGKTGLKLASVGFGCMVTSDATVVEKAADLGVNFFDTCREYQGGNNERMLGAAIKGKRDKVHISTKTAALEKADALADLETSLRTLETDYIDVWMLHNKSRPNELTPDLIEALELAKQQGKARFTGVSTHRGQAHVIPAAIETGKIDVVMITYNFAMDLSKVEPLLESAHAAGVGVVAMKVLAGSFRLDPAMFDKSRPIMKRPGGGLAALKWALRNKNVDVAIPSIVDMNELEEDLKALSVPFKRADEEVLKAYLDQFGPRICRMCGECESKCTKGLSVADMIRCLAYADGYRQYPLARERFLELPRQARDVRCDCPTCAIKCPNNVRVATYVRRAQRMLA